MIRIDVPFVNYFTSKRKRPVVQTGVTAGSKLNIMSVTLRWLDDYFLYRTVCTSLSLSIRYLPIFFLVGQSTSAKKSLVVPPSVFSLKKAVYYDLICSSIRPSSPSPFHVVSLSISSFFPTTGVPRSATLRHLSTRGFFPDDDHPRPQAENSSTSIFRNI